jgi:hypothetical protein
VGASGVFGKSRCCLGSNCCGVMVVGADGATSMLAFDGWAQLSGWKLRRTGDDGALRSCGPSTFGTTGKGFEAFSKLCARLCVKLSVLSGGGRLGTGTGFR